MNERVNCDGARRKERRERMNDRYTRVLWMRCEVTSESENKTGSTNNSNLTRSEPDVFQLSVNSQTT